MNRLEVVVLGLVVEWDEVTGEATVGCAAQSGWEMISGIREAVDRVSGGFEDLGLVERRSTRPAGEGLESCFESLRGAERVVVWRARFVEAAESRRVAEVVRAVLRELDGLPRGN